MLLGLRTTQDLKKKETMLGYSHFDLFIFYAAHVRCLSYDHGKVNNSGYSPGKLYTQSVFIK